MRRVLLVCAAIAAALIAGFVLLPREQRTSARARDFAGFAERMRVEAALPGMSVVVISDGQVVHSAGYGFADVAARRPMTPDTPMNIASVSKPILGIALLRLRDDGKLDLDADVNDYLTFRVDNPHLEGERITVRTLAAHTSGIADFYDVDDYAAGVDSPVPLVGYVEALLAQGGERYEGGAHYLDAAPGDVREYSNLGAGLAGAVAENAAGESLEAFQGRTLFEPLGMHSTSWRIAHYRADALAVRYKVRQCAPVIGLCADTEEPVWNEVLAFVFDPPHRYKTFAAYPQLGNPDYPDGGLNASARDLGMLMQWILNDGAWNGPTLLSEASFEDMFTLQAEALDQRQRFFWRDRDGFTGHAGSDRGVFTYFYFDREHRDGFVVLINRTPDAGTESAMDALAARIRADFFGEAAAMK